MAGTSRDGHDLGGEVVALEEGAAAAAELLLMMAAERPDSRHAAMTSWMYGVGSSVDCCQFQLRQPGLDASA